MARFMATIKGHIGEKGTNASRLGNRYIHAKVNSNNTEVFTSMWQDGDKTRCCVSMRNPLTGGIKTLFDGFIN